MTVLAYLGSHSKSVVIGGQTLGFLDLAVVVETTSIGHELGSVGPRGTA